jgi:hypothetical protein
MGRVVKSLNPSESQIQCAFIDWFRAKFPKNMIFAVPNGGSRNKLEAINLKRQGVLAGVPDICIPFFEIANKGFGIEGNISLWIELKSPKNYPTEKQREVMRKLHDSALHIVLWSDSLDDLIGFFTELSDKDRKKPMDYYVLMPENCDDERYHFKLVFDKF